MISVSSPVEFFLLPWTDAEGELCELLLAVEVEEYIPGFPHSADPSNPTDDLFLAITDSIASSRMDGFFSATIASDV